MISSLDTLSRSDESTRPKRSPAWLFPTAIATGFLLVFLAIFRDRLLPAAHVQVATVLTTPAAAGKTTDAPPPASGSVDGPMIFQASGWLEPAPQPVKASALVDGVVATVNVLEGDSVEKGQLLATLVDDDARLALQTAERHLQTLISMHAAHRGAVETMKRKLSSAESAILAARAMEEEARDQSKRFDSLSSGAVSRSDVTAAKLRLSRETAQRSMAESGRDEVEAEIARLELESVVRQDEIASARVGVEKAELALARTRITAPISGRILKLPVTPGQKRMLAMDEADSSTIATLYDPARLQARVDVPLADAGRLRVGQAVRVHCGLLQDRVFKGEVTGIGGEADLQRNTLQAKVRIIDPEDSLRPEMLCRAEFLAPADSSASPGLAYTAGENLDLWVPESAVRGESVWLCDPATKRVKAVRIQVTGPAKDGYLPVNDALKPGEWVVIDPPSLREGQRVNPESAEP